MKILIVEDDFASRLVIKKLMSKYGYCDEVVNGNEAVKAFRYAHDEGAPYDLILLDIMMPEMNGKDALKKIREYEREMNLNFRQEVKVIMLTALDSPGDVIESYYDGGCTAYLVKPIRRNKLIDLMREYKFIE
mgnify:CR=1 FL=1